MSQPIFYRNVRARHLLEIFLVSAVTSLLLLRFYLSVTGYPQVGGGSLHVAHVLWGGILMMVALALTLTFLGQRAQRMTAIIGGVGFGIFIDEIGKFLTRDNNYFFRPTVGIIYAIFAIMYLTFNFLARDQKLTSREYQLNALVQLEEAIAHNMDANEKAEVRRLLNHASPHSALTVELKRLLDSVETVPADQPSRFSRWLHWVDRTYRRFWALRSSSGLVRSFFVIVTLLFLAGVILPIAHNVDTVLDIFRGAPTYAHILLIGQLAASALAAAFVLWGVAILRKSHLHAFEQFRRATLVNIFLTEFFIFSRVQFAAIPGLLFNLVLLILINFVLYQEYRQQHHNGTDAPT